MRKIRIMATVPAIREAFQKWLSDELKIPVIFSDQTAPRPQKPYATIRIGTENSLGLRDELRSVDKLGKAFYIGQRAMAVTLNLFGSNALELMEKAQSSLSKQKVLDRFYQDYGITILDDSKITNLTNFLETISEERAQMEVEIGYNIEFEEDLGYIEFIELNDKEIVHLP